MAGCYPSPVLPVVLASCQLVAMVSTGGLVATVSGRASAPRRDRLNQTSRTQVRVLLRSLCIVLAILQAWISRNLMDPDGTAYADLAKAWLRGDWLTALNSYWSPLYPWLTAAVYAIFRPGIRWQIFALHALNLGGFLAALAAWEWLMREWERWQGPPSHPLLVTAASYGVFGWAGLRLNGLAFTSADIFLTAILIALAALLVRLRRGVSEKRDFVWIGLAMAFGFLAKAAFATVAPVLLVELAILLHSWRNPRLYIAAGIALAGVLFFMIPLSISKGRLTIGDAGAVNYSWQVTGMSIEGYKENAYSPGAAARHPVAVLLDNPRVIGLGEHLVGTMPLHADPAWWSEGFPVRFDRDRQLMILASNIAYCSIKCAACPGLWLMAVCACVSFRRVRRQFRALWFLWLPALVMIGSYCAVYVLTRYLAGPFALLGFAMVAAAWNVRLPRPIERAAPVALALACTATLWFELLGVPFWSVGDLSGHMRPIGFENVPVAETLQRAGLRPDDKVAFVGNGLLSAWLGLDGARVVAMVPARIWHDDRTLGRELKSSFEKPDHFWRSEPAARRRAFDAFRRAGAKWVFATDVPAWADTSGWTSAGEAHQFRNADSPFVWYKKLD